MSEGKIIDFIFNSQQGELIQKEGRQTQKLKIGDKTYKYDKNKPVSKVLNTKLKEVARSNDYRKHRLLMKSANYLKLTRGKPLQDYVKQFKSKVTDEQQAFKGYANTYSVSDIRLKGMKGLSYSKYQKQRLSDFLNRNPTMQIIVEADLSFKNPNNEVYFFYFPPPPCHPPPPPYRPGRSVCLCRGTCSRIFRIWGSKPMSSMRSAYQGVQNGPVLGLGCHHGGFM